MLLSYYEQLVKDGLLRTDTGQHHAVTALDGLLEQVATAPAAAGFSLFGLRKAVPQKAGGLYLWGDVGRGKSMVMDLFVDVLKKLKLTRSVRRVHFHAFMLDVHKRMFVNRQRGGDAVEQVIHEIASEMQVLCLDELQVTDVADAMILARLFAGLMDNGVTVVFTSNRPPRELYQGGLQRDQFLKFVDLLEQRIPIVELGGAIDYRLAQHKSLTRRYVYPLDDAADDFLLASWKALTGGDASEPLRLEHEGRILRVDKQAHGIAWFTFDELCARPLGASDYLMIARLFHTVVLQNIPKLGPEYRNEARRFVTLIDALYDHRVKLLATAATAPDDMYPQGDGTFEFHRTVSRLHEMQADSYLELAHIA